ncbi:MAG: hypothetical protein ACYC2X_11925, partial [Coriobacteriia bacterium]
YLGQSSAGDHVIAWIKQIPRDPTAVTTDTMEVERFGPDGRLVASVLTARGIRRRGSPIAFSPHSLAARVQDTLFVVDGFSGTITVWSVTGEPTRRIQVPAQPEAPPDAHRLLEQRLMDARGDRVAGLSRDSLGVERAVVYEVHRDVPAP